MTDVLFRKIDTFLHSLNITLHRRRIWAGVSGGPDSVFLLEYLLHKKKSIDFNLTILHVNHLLRGKESDEDENFVRKLAEKYSVPVVVERVDVKKLKKRGESIEEAARRLRYEVFEKHQEKYDYFFTAHNLDDNVETLLFNFFRGTGARGLAGIPPVRGKFVRPLLQISRQEIIDFLEKNGISYRIDSTNYDTAYTRNLIRHEIIPFLSEKLGRDLVKRLGENILVFRRLKDFIEKHTEKLFAHLCKAERNCIICELAGMLDLSEFERGEVIIHAFKQLGMKGGALEVVRAVEKILQTSHESMTPVAEDFFSFRCGDKLLFCRGKFEELIDFPSLELTFPFNERWGIWQIVGDEEFPGEGDYSGSFSHQDFPGGKVIIRSYKPGDRIQLRYGERVITKKLKDLFSSRKIGKIERKFIPLFLNSRGEIVWIPGVAFKAGSGGDEFYVVVRKSLLG